jgi:ABC-type xylose transport system permease subunit
MAFVQEESTLVPVLFGIFGGIAGMFVADWWTDRNCRETCGQADIPSLFLGGALGAMLGYLIGGGEIPEEPRPGW